MNYKIENNYLLLNKQRDFNNTLLKYFYERLNLFLCTNTSIVPKVLFTSNKGKIKEIYSDEYDDCRAFYDENTATVVFFSTKYKVKNTEFVFNIDTITNDLPNINLNDWTYIIPLSDIYHELIHHIQYNHSIYDYTDFIEGIDDIFTYFITGQWNIDYLKQSISVWNLSFNLLYLKPSTFYVFIRDCITTPTYINDYFLNDKKFIKMLSNEYNGNILKFFNNFTNKFGILSYEQKFYNSLSKIHNLIFYKY